MGSLRFFEQAEVRTSGATAKQEIENADAQAW
jgi:hypothetical protein